MSASELEKITLIYATTYMRRPVDAKLAAEIREFRSPTDGETRMFYEIVIAPGYTPDGLEVLKGKSKTVSTSSSMCSRCRAAPSAARPRLESG